MTLKLPIPVKTPNYVLLEEKLRIGPNVIPPDTGPELSVVYGFSDKEPYDRFTVNSGRHLRPYPLVTGHLNNPGGAPEDVLGLVVIDATGPDEKCLKAVTMDLVRQAQKNGDVHLKETHRLLFDEQANAYTVEKI